MSPLEMPQIMNVLPTQIVYFAKVEQTHRSSQEILIASHEIDVLTYWYV